MFKKSLDKIKGYISKTNVRGLKMHKRSFSNLKKLDTTKIKLVPRSKKLLSGFGVKMNINKKIKFLG